MMDMGCRNPAWCPRPEWVLAAFQATRRCALMVPTLWVCINLLAAVRASAGIPVSMADMCTLLHGKGDTMHYEDMTPPGEALFAEWLTEAAEGRCNHAGVLVQVARPRCCLAQVAEVQRLRFFSCPRDDSLVGGKR